MTFKLVPITSIKVGSQKTDAEHVKNLAASIDEVDLLEPVLVNEDMKLLGGHHRYRASRLAGKTKIPVHVLDLDEAGQRMATLDSNLLQKHRPALELAELMRERKDLYEAAHPEAKQGGDRAKRKSVPSGAAVIAKKAQRTERSVRQYVEVAEKLDPKAKKSLKGTDAADSITDLQRLAKMEPAQQREVAAQVAETGATVKQAARTLNNEKLVAQARVYVPPTGEFEVITTDYPWEFDDQLDGSDAVRGGCPYPPMPIEEICAFPIPCAKDCALFVWVTNQHTIDGSYDKVRQSLADRYGFAPKGLATWDKDKMGTGWWFRNQTEHLVLFVRGSPVFTEEKLRSLIRAPLGDHSEKPAAFYMAIERYCASTSRLEMFARAPRNGWVTSGSELAAAPAAPAKKKKQARIIDVTEAA